MKKKNIIYIAIGVAAIILVCLIFGGERAGVSSKRIRTDVEDNNYYSVKNISYKHNVDRTRHTDNVIVSYDTEYAYGTHRTVEEYRYFYNKSLDLWELKNHIFISGESELSKKIASAKFIGSDEGPFQDGIRYDIAVVDVDYDNCGVTVSYKITEGDNVFSGQAEVGYGDGYESEYTVVGQRAIRIIISFSLDGIRAEYDW